MASDKRSGSQLLRDVETKVDQLYHYVQNLDNNIKILLNNFNKLANTNVVVSSSIPEKKEESSEKRGEIKVQENKVVKEKPEAIDGLKKKYKFEDLPQTNRFEQLAKKFTGNEPEPEAILSDAEKDELVEAGAKVGKQRVRRSSGDDGKVVNVKQQVLYPNGSPVMIAMVEIFDSQGKKLRTLRTNSKGRWNTPLVPGEYKFHIVKHVAPDSGKEPFDVFEEHDIPPGKEFEIPSPNVGE